MNTKPTIQPPRIIPGGQYQTIITDRDGYEIAAFWAESGEKSQLMARNFSHLSEMVDALTLLLNGAQSAQKMGVVQPQLNGGVVLAQSVLDKLNTTN